MITYKSAAELKKIATSAKIVSIALIELKKKSSPE